MSVEAAAVAVEHYGDYVRTEWKLLCERRLAAPDLSPVDLAKGLGFSASTVRIWLRSPHYQRYENFVIAQRRVELTREQVAPSSRFATETVPERFQEYQASMQERLLDIIETSENQKLVSELCKDWMAYGGVVPKATPQQGSRVPALSEEMILMFARRAMESGLDFAVAGVRISATDGNTVEQSPG
jgi:hypothetical protein